MLLFSALGANLGAGIGLLDPREYIVLDTLHLILELYPLVNGSLSNFFLEIVKG